MVFENGVKNIQAAAYIGARTVWIMSFGQGVEFLKLTSNVYLFIYLLLLDQKEERVALQLL